MASGSYGDDGRSVRCFGFYMDFKTVDELFTRSLYDSSLRLL